MITDDDLLKIEQYAKDHQGSVGSIEYMLSRHVLALVEEVIKQRDIITARGRALSRITIALTEPFGEKE